MAEVADPDFDVDGVELLQPATASTVVAIPATANCEILIASSSLPGSFWRRTSYDWVGLASEPHSTSRHDAGMPRKVLVATKGYSSWSRRLRKVLVRMRETCIWDTPIRSAIWL